MSLQVFRRGAVTLVLLATFKKNTRPVSVRTDIFTHVPAWQQKDALDEL